MTMSQPENIMTAFLFGNFDEEGNLEGENIFDDETRSHLVNLGSYLSSQETLEACSGGGGLLPASSSRRLDRSIDDDDDLQRSDEDSNNDDDEQESKASSALDFEYMDEAIEEDDLPLNGVHEKMSESDEDEQYQTLEMSDDSCDEVEQDDDDAEGVERPLANMLPDLYRGFNVRTFFPAFRINKVLRFSVLFGPGKQSSMPRIWRNVKTARRKNSDGKLDQKLDDTKITVEDEQIEYETDDEILLMKPQHLSSRLNRSKVEESETKVAAWRYGPAAYWYDQMGVPPGAQNFDYNIKNIMSDQKFDKDIKQEPSNGLEKTADIKIDEQLFLPYNMIKWEDNIIWDGEEVRQEVLQKLTSGRQPLCGWIPTNQTRTYESFMAMYNCIFPPDNLDLIYGDWEKEIIIDATKMDHIPEPKIPTIDLCDDPLLYGIPEDLPREDIACTSAAPTSNANLNSSDELNTSKASIDRKDHQFTKKSQLILGRVAQRQREEEEEAANLHMTEKDNFNLSNDDYYRAKGATATNNFSGSMIQHSIPAQNLMQPFFNTYFNVFKLRHFHRLPMKKFGANKSILSKPIFHSVQYLEKYVTDRSQMREHERIASGGGEMFFMRKPEDLSGKDGELIFCEYSEEHPPLLMQPGMATKIKNFYKRAIFIYELCRYHRAVVCSERPGGKDNCEPKFEYGETSYTHTTPFLGSLAPGETLQALENNLFRAPIYRHSTPSSNFLIIRDRNGYSLRQCPTIYLIGQECPLFEVPGPNSKRASNFVRDYLLVYIYRLFWQSKETPKRLKMEDVRRAFPHYAESTIRKRLKLCSDFKRMGAGPESNYWVLRPDFRLPDLEEIRSMVSPEMCCAYFSMQAAEQLLKDAGYGERYFFAPEDDEEDNDQTKMADEIKCAPWNTTRAYLSAMKGKYLLDLTGVADPTGCGEGFSYVRVTAKPPKDDLPPQAKRSVTGTDADLRKLSLKDAKLLLKDFGVRDDEIKTLTRWEIIDVIRTLSTQQAKSGGAGVTKFARGNTKYSVAEVQDRYRQECQRIFDLQNRVLSSTEYLSTDDEDSDNGDSDIEEMGKNIETMLSSKKAQLDEEKAEREELRKFLCGETDSKMKVIDDKDQMGDQSNLNADLLSSFHLHDNRKLKIYRTRVDEKGREFVNIEVVTKPQLIEAYLKIRTTKDDAFIKHFAQMDEQYKEEKRREKRRLQDQLRRIRRNEIKAQMGLPLGRPPKPEKARKTPPPPKPSLLKMRCSACNGTGHMKTNKNCPLYGQRRRRPYGSGTGRGRSLGVALTDEQIEQEMSKEEEAESGNNVFRSATNLTSIEGTKIKLSRAVLERTEKMRKKALKLKFPKFILQQTPKPPGPGRGRKRKIPIPEGMAPAPKKSDETDIEKSINRVLSEKLNPKKGQFSRRPSLVPHGEMDIMGRSEAGPSTSMLASSINKPVVHRRRADPKVTMSLVLERILNQLKSHPCSTQFLTSVSKKLVPDYYKIIKRPMDLQMIKMNLTRNQYLTREEFLKDIQQILDNSRLYNGDQHPITQAARELFELALKLITEREQKLMKIEKQINPLLDDNDVVAFCFILDRIVQECKKTPKSFIFHHPVDKKKYATYYEKIKKPMDLGTMEIKCKRHQYESVGQFLRDAELIFRNCEIFNSPESPFTNKAREIMETAKKFVAQNAQHLADLEKRIQASKQKVLEDMETLSQATGISSLTGDYSADRQNDDLTMSAMEEPSSSSGLAPAYTTLGVAGDETSLLQHDLLMSDGEDDAAGDGDSSSPARPVDYAAMGDDDVDRLIRQTFDDDEEDSAMLAAGEDDEAGQTSAEKVDIEDPIMEASTSRMSNFRESDDEPTSGPRCDIEALSRAGTSDEDEEEPVSDSHLARMLDQSSMAKSARLLNDLAMSDSGSDIEDDDLSHRRDSTTNRRSAGGGGDDEDCDFSTL